MVHVFLFFRVHAFVCMCRVLLFCGVMFSVLQSFSYGVSLRSKFLMRDRCVLNSRACTSAPMPLWPVPTMHVIDGKAVRREP